MTDRLVQTPTFLFTDIEGSTNLWERSPDAMRQVMVRHDALAREIVERHRGRIVKDRGEGDSLFCVFEDPAAAVMAACSLQAAFHSEPWGVGRAVRVRMALHRGSVDVREEDYYGQAVNRCARLRAIGHGGQILISEAVFELLENALPESVTLRDLGRHRLKDLQQPEQVYQVCLPAVPQEFPKLLSLNYLQHNLPVQTTSFVGREREIAEIRRLLEGTAPLTLVGAGGSGKTRLALQAAADRVDQMPDGIWIVDLASVSDPALVPQSVAAVLGVREEPGESLLQTLCATLKPRTLLLLLDNCEHLVAACAVLVEAVTRACQNARILSTSRERLGISGERVYQVQALALPPVRPALPDADPTTVDLSGMLQYASVRLFCERAVLQQPDFMLSSSNAAAVAQICGKLDGIPLALELAAARIRSLSPSQVLARLDDRFRLLRGGSRTALPRQQTLEALIGWSYDLLIPEEKSLLHALTVFAGGWTLEAAERVASEEEWQVLDLLTALVDKSLVVFSGDETGGRYRLLETIRQYAAMKISQAAYGDEVESRHTAYFLTLAREAERHLQGPDQAEWLKRLEQDNDNLRAVLGRCLPEDRRTSSDRAGHGLALCGALWWFWHVRGYLKEGRSWLARALAVNPAPSESRANALTGLGMLALQSNDLQVADSAHREALGIRRANHDKRGSAASLSNLGSVALECNQWELAREFYQEAIALWEDLGENDALARTWNDLGNVAYMQGDLTTARNLYSRGLERLRAGLDTRNIAVPLYNLAELALGEEDYSAAEIYLIECLTYLERVDDRYLTAYAVHMLGSLAHHTGRDPAAVRLWSAAQAAFENIGASLKPADSQILESAKRQVREKFGEERFGELWRAGRVIPLSEAAAQLQDTTSPPTGS